MKKIVLNDQKLIEYYNYVKGQKTLSLNELEELLNKDDKEAKQEFINAFLYYVFVYAYYIYNHYIEQFRTDYKFEDFLQDGNLLLLSIIKNKSEETSFNSFCWYFWNNLKRVFDYKVSKLKTVLSLSTKLQVLRAYNDFYRDNGREATVQELMEITGLRKYLIDASIVSDDLDISTISKRNLDRLVGTYEVEDMVIDRITQEEDQEVINTCLMALNEKRQMIMEKVYGLNGTCEKSLSEIAEELDVSKQCVHEMKKRSLKRIYKVNKEFLESYHEIRF